MNFQNTLIRCSSLSCLFTEPQSKEAKARGDLSQTAKKHLYKVYSQILWGKYRDITTKYTEKGKLCQEEATTMISRLDGVMYSTNKTRKSNEWITGECDIEAPEEIQDVKCSWDAETFTPNIVEPLSDEYEYQAQGYMWLWDKQIARVRYCLVSAPEKILMDEKYKLLRQMDVATEENPLFVEAWEELRFNLTFDEIPIEHRVIDKIVKRNESIIEQIPSKVKKARLFLKELHEKHMKFQVA
jgi:hypothetical protein